MPYNGKVALFHGMFGSIKGREEGGKEGKSKEEKGKEKRVVKL